MGTRSFTTIRSRSNNTVDYSTHAVIYRHWAGYLSGQGRLLFEFLDGLAVINGIPSNPPPRFANGPGRLAAQFVAKMQEEGTDPNLFPAVCDCGQEFHYQVDVDYFTGGGIIVTVFDGPVTAFGAGGEDCTNLIFKGTVAEYGTFLDEKGDDS